MSYLQLGSVRMDLITWVNGFEAGYGYAYASHDIIEGKSHLQWTGDALETRELKAQLHMRYCDPKAEFEKLKAAAERHQALSMFFANGTFEGRFVIEGLQRTLEHTDKLGNIYLMQLSIRLKEWSEPSSESLGQGLADSAFGRALVLGGNRPSWRFSAPANSSAAARAFAGVQVENRIVRQIGEVIQ